MNNEMNTNSQSKTDAKKQNTYMNVAVMMDGIMVVMDHFNLVHFQGQESTSQPFSYQLELHINTLFTSSQEESTVPDFAFDDVIGQSITVGIITSDEDGTDEDFKKLIKDKPKSEHANEVKGFSIFNGIITSSSITAVGVYHVTMQPNLYRLSLVNNYRIFKKLELWQVIQDVLLGHDISGSDIDLTHLMNNTNLANIRQQDWLQSGETDLEFIKRLMQKAGLYYYFRHYANQHTLVISNSTLYPKVFTEPNIETVVRYTFTSEDHLALEQENLITNFNLEKKLAATQVSSLVTTCPPATDFKGYDTGEQVNYTDYQDNGDDANLVVKSYQTFSNGGCETEAQLYRQEQSKMLDTAASSFSGSSTCKLFRVGYQFSTQAHLAGADGVGSPRNGKIPKLEGNAFVLTSVSHDCRLAGTYSNQFASTPFDDNTQLASYSPQDTHQGSIIAQVVAAPAENDELTALFASDHFSNCEQETTYNASSSGLSQQIETQGVYVILSTDELASKQDDRKAVWVRLSATMKTAPAIGSIVVISRSQDSQEEPEIQFVRLTRGDEVVTPDNFSADNYVGKSYSTRYSQSVGINLPYNAPNPSDTDLAKITTIVDGMYKDGANSTADQCANKAFKDVNYSIGGGYSYSEAEGGRTGILSESESVGCSYNTSDAAQSKSWTTCDDVYSESTHIDVTSVSTISGLQKNTSTLHDSVSDSTTNGTTTSTQIFNGKVSSNTTHNGDVSNYTTITGEQYSNTKTTTSIDMRTIGTTSGTTTIGFSGTASAIGMSGTASATGASANASATGASANVSATGASANVSITGVSGNASTIGMDNTLTIKAMNNSFEMTGGGFCGRLGPAQQITEISASEITAKLNGIKSTLLIGIRSIM